MRFGFSALSIAIVGLLSQAVAAYPNPGRPRSKWVGNYLMYIYLGAVSGSIDVHDPSICRDSAGKYFLFGEF